MLRRLTREERGLVESNLEEFIAGTSRREDCPSDTALRAYNFGYMPWISRIATHFHVNGCVACFARLKRLECECEEAEVPLRMIRARVLSELSAQVPEGRVTAWWKPATVAVVASVFVVAIAAGIFLRRTSEEVPVYRGTESRIQAQVSHVAPMPIEIRWKSVPGAEYYNVDIYRADLQELVFKTRLPSAKYTLTEKEMALLEKGDTYYCRIEAMNEFNEVVAKSEGLPFSMASGDSGVIASNQN